ncbi:MAG: TolC family protein [Planctomycetaceae bacterium]
MKLTGIVTHKSRSWAARREKGVVRSNSPTLDEDSDGVRELEPVPAAVPRHASLCPGHPAHGVRSLAVFTFAVAIALLSSGCSRPFWRKQADLDSYTLAYEKQNDPLWDVPRVEILPDPSSRFYDVYDPDCGPLPPDDPAAHVYMHCPGGFAGSSYWHKIGTSLAIENPHWLDPFGLAEPSEQTTAEPASQRKIENLTLSQSIELSYIHSREYQTAIEDVYLAALALTFERFQFAVRYLGFSGEPSADLTYETIPGGQNSLAFTPRIGVSQLLPTGGQWIVELANNTLWLFSGPNQTQTASALSFSLVQPLLLGAGRKVVLEALTQTERDLLYETRDLARFRQEFFVDTVATGPGGGFLGLLQQRQSVINQQANLRQLNERLEQQRAITSQLVAEVPLEALPNDVAIPESLERRVRFERLRKVLRWNGEMTDEQKQLMLGLSSDAAWPRIVESLENQLQINAQTASLPVLQLQSQIASSQGQLRVAERAFQDRLDQFKVHLGLPPDLQITIDEMLLDQFTLIDPELTALEKMADDFTAEWGVLDEEQPDIAAMRRVHEEMIRLKDVVRSKGLPLLDRDFERVEQNMTDRLAQLATDADRQQVRDNVSRDRSLYDNLKRDLEEIEKSLNEVRTELDAVPAGGQLAADQNRRLVRALGTLREDIEKNTQSLQVTQIGLRTELIKTEPVDLSMDAAIQTALESRVDLMNSLALVTDARSRVEVAANRLEAMLDVVVEGDVRTPVGQKPFDFRGSQSSYRAGLRFTAPLDQIAERNAYRAAQIDYQRARRNYIAFEDRVKSEIRLSFRQLDVLRLNFETARQAVRISALEYDSAVEQISAPGQQGGQSAINLLRALDNVLNAQEALIQTWVQYEQSRLNIHRDMGMMDIDADGVWNDRLYRQPANTREGLHAIPPLPAEDPETAGRSSTSGSSVVFERRPAGDREDPSRARSLHEESIGRAGAQRTEASEAPELTRALGDEPADSGRAGIRNLRSLDEDHAFVGEGIP